MRTVSAPSHAEYGAELRQRRVDVHADASGCLGDGRIHLDEVTHGRGPLVKGVGDAVGDGELGLQPGGRRVDVGGLTRDRVHVDADVLRLGTPPRTGGGVDRGVGAQAGRMQLDPVGLDAEASVGSWGWPTGREYAGEAERAFGRSGVDRGAGTGQQRSLDARGRGQTDLDRLGV